MKLLKYQVGELVCLTEGDYEDNRVYGLTRVLKDFDAEELVKEWAVDNGTLFEYHNHQHYDINEGAIKFDDWLVDQGYLERIGFRVMHLGGTDTVELDDFTPDQD